MANAYALAEEHLAAGIAAAAEQNVDLNAYGQALVWKLIEAYQKAGRTNDDIISEVKYTLDNIADDGTFHVSRN